MLTVLSDEPEDAGSCHGHLWVRTDIRTGGNRLVWVGGTAKVMAAICAGLLSSRCPRMGVKGWNKFLSGAFHKQHPIPYGFISMGKAARP